LIGHAAYCQPARSPTERAVETAVQKLRNVDPPTANAAELVTQRRQIFRFDTFGDETFWGDVLNSHLAAEGAAFGGEGPGLRPKGALAAGLKIDADALPRDLLEQLSKGKVNLNDPAVTLELLKLNAVIAVNRLF